MTMGKFHFQKNTVEASCWCAPCGKETPHRIDNGRRGPCLVCLGKLGNAAETKEPAPPTQEELFS